ncbi:MAG: tRNA-dihydrouridine synthase [Deltaproteobacteria bacterium]|jgi:nifR3 family TIM-barrel protein|nr:tRNA-dihydrouridine synthase [Deltaproteobacteria bacterium]
MKSQHLKKIPPPIGKIQLKNPFVLAPMAGITNQSYRKLSAAFGAALTYSEMASAVALSYQGKKTLGLLIPQETVVPEIHFELNEFSYDFGVKVPYAVQLFGKAPEVMAEAAIKAVELAGADIIDLNFACPARKVINSGHGAKLLQDPKVILEITEAVARRVTVPVTVKTRPAFERPSDPEKALIYTLGPQLENCGAQAITLHPRYAKEGFTGEADWSIVRTLQSLVKIPVIGSGDINSAELALERLKESQCAYVMLGRATRGRPWLFAQCVALWEGRPPLEISPEEALKIAIQHARLLHEEIGHRAAFLLRTVLIWYTKNLPWAAKARNLINHEENVEKQIEILVRAFRRAEAEKNFEEP